MKKGTFKKFITSPYTTLAAFGLAAGLLLFSSIGGARAALTYYSETYSSRIQMYEIDVMLVENERQVEGELLKDMLPEGETLKPGKVYKEELSVYNSGMIGQYVRVSLYKYWMDEAGEKLVTLSPELIDLHLVNLGTDWLVDEEASTRERTVIYYNKVLATETETPLFADTLTINGDIAAKVSQTTETKDGYTTIHTVYDYDGVRFALEARVDAVQEHNAEDAAWSAWGRRVHVSDGILSLE